MDVVLIFNGLGNQMSQYAFYMAKKHKVHSCKVTFDYSKRYEHNGFELENIFGIKLSPFWMWLYYFLTREKVKKTIGWIYPFIGIRFIKEPQNYDYKPILTEKGRWGINFYWGGWHSEKYFFDIRDEVKQVFRFPQIDDKECNRYANLIMNSKNSVSLHVRRGDYVNIRPDDFYQLNGVATTKYYKNAIERMEKEVGKCTYFVFSNDLDWCREEFKLLDAYYVDCNSGNNSWRDIYLMTLCQHHINANSTFSWWGAWLSSHDGVIICPERFIRTVETKDFYPEKWIKIPGEKGYYNTYY